MTSIHQILNCTGLRIKHLVITLGVGFSLIGCNTDDFNEEEIGSVESALSLIPSGVPTGYGPVVGVNASSDGFLKCVKTDQGPWNSTEGGLVEFYLDGQFFTSVEYAPQPKVGGSLFDISADKSVFTKFQGGKHTAQCIAYPYEGGLLMGSAPGFETCSQYACTRSAVWGFYLVNDGKKPGYCDADFPGNGGGVHENIANNCGPSSGDTYKKILDVPHYYQDQPCWCSVTVVEMWADYWNNATWSATHQASLADTYSIPATGCKTGDGMNVNELAAAVEAETGHWMKRDKTPDKVAFARRIVEQINAGKPVAVTGYTRYINEPAQANQHWFLVHGFENTGAEFSTDYSRIKCFYLQDSVYESALDHVYSTSPDTCISPDEFFNEFASKSNGQYYLVREKNGWFDGGDF